MCISFNENISLILMNFLLHLARYSHLYNVFELKTRKQKFIFP